jgi:hypothetical protein
MGGKSGYVIMTGERRRRSSCLSVLGGRSRRGSRRIAVCLEVTPKETFASALDWPGWCRAGRDEGAALAALAGYAEWYAPVADQAGLSFPSTFAVVERLPGGPTTAFAASECRRPFPQVTARPGRTGEGDPGRGPAPGRTGQRGLGGLRRGRRRGTGRAAQGPARRESVGWSGRAARAGIGSARTMPGRGGQLPHGLCSSVGTVREAMAEPSMRRDW